MPLSIPEALDASAAQATAKADAARRPGAYLLTSALAGAYVGIAVVLLLSVGGPLVAASSPLARLVQGGVFGVALTLVVFAGAELFTGNVMFMLHGLSLRKVTRRALAVVGAVSLVGNVIGSIAFAALVHGAGTLSAGGAAGKPAPAAALLESVLDAKAAASGGALFWRAVLCNALVCLGLWMATRATTDGAKLVVLWWALLAFVASGFEHSIANVTTFALGIFAGHATWAELLRNLALTIPGNVVGGGLLVGAAYGWLYRPKPVPADSGVRAPVAVPETKPAAVPAAVSA